jgi:hypothetical protein
MRDGRPRRAAARTLRRASDGEGRRALLTVTGRVLSDGSEIWPCRLRKTLRGGIDTESSGHGQAHAVEGRELVGVGGLVWRGARSDAVGWRHPVEERSHPALRDREPQAHGALL